MPTIILSPQQVADLRERFADLENYAEHLHRGGCVSRDEHTMSQKNLDRRAADKAEPRRKSEAAQRWLEAENAQKAGK